MRGCTAAHGMECVTARARSTGSNGAEIDTAKAKPLGSRSIAEARYHMWSVMMDWIVRMRTASPLEAANADERHLALQRGRDA